MKLTPNQKSAVEHKLANLQLIACAGSGKTEVVARRVAHLLTPTAQGGSGLVPNNIVAFTFTEKAAAELKDRVIARCEETLGQVHGVAEMYVGTIHAFCLELLKTEVPKYLKYEVLNDVQQVLFTDRHSRASGLTDSSDLKGLALKRWRDTPHYLQALSILREAELNKKALKGCSVLKGFESYRQLLDERGYLDYSGILEAAAHAMNHDAGVRERLSERIRYVIVDEYQDVNPIQESIVTSLHKMGAKICVVGDDDQTIYQWRGSNVQNILTFEDRYPAVKQIKLEENFRSSRGIVETARDFIAQNGERLEKAMLPTDAQPFEDGDIVAVSFNDPNEEAQYIVNSIKALHGVAFSEDGKNRGLAWSDMAILLRSVRANGGPIFRALKEAGIRCVVAGMNNLFDTREAEAARTLFYFMADHLGTDKAVVKKAWKAADLGLAEADLNKAVLNAEASRALFPSPTERFGFYSIQRTFLKFIEDAGLREENVPGDGRGEIVFYNLGKFSQLISDFEAIHFHSKPAEKYKTFANFLQYHADKAYPEGWLDNQYATPDAVRIMTVHQAKGMQWPVVFIPALLGNRFPGRKPGGRTVWHLLPAAGVKDQGRYAGSIEDERRLFYVAMTRSQKFLHMTWAPIPGNQQAKQASQFWTDVLASKWVKRRIQTYAKRDRLTPQPKSSISRVAFSFSDIKYFFECPYQFKLRNSLRL